MRCENCNASIPRGVGSCPSCGVFSGVHPRRQPRKRSGAADVLPVLVLITMAAIGGWWWLHRPPASKSDVHPKPPAVVTVSSEADAIAALRRHLAGPETKEECVAVLSHGRKGNAYELTAVNSCQHTTLGTWRVPHGRGVPSRVK